MREESNLHVVCFLGIWIWKTSQNHDRCSFSYKAIWKLHLREDDNSSYTREEALQIHYLLVWWNQHKNVNIRHGKEDAHIPLWRRTVAKFPPEASSLPSCLMRTATLSSAEALGVAVRYARCKARKACVPPAAYWRRLYQQLEASSPSPLPLPRAHRSAISASSAAAAAPRCAFAGGGGAAAPADRCSGSPMRQPLMF